MYEKKFIKLHMKQGETKRLKEEIKYKYNQRLKVYVKVSSI